MHGIFEDRKEASAGINPCATMRSAKCYVAQDFTGFPATRYPGQGQRLVMGLDKLLGASRDPEKAKNKCISAIALLYRDFTKW